MRRHLISTMFILLALLPTTATAHDFEVDGIYYNINGNYTGNGNEVTVTSGPNEYTGDLTIPATVTYNGTTYSVTSIFQSAFEGCTRLISVNIPNSVIDIGWYAFEGCTGLTSVTIPNSVAYIGEDAFAYCPLIRVNITDLASWCRITIYPSWWGFYPYCCSNPHGYLFLNGTEVTNLDIPNSISTINSYVFYGYKLTSVNIPNSVNFIGEAAFAACNGLTSLTVASGNTTFDSRSDCNGIIHTTTNTLIVGCKNTVIPNSVSRIGDRAFFGCTGLTNVSIPDSVTKIENLAFYGCNGLNSVTIGNSVTSIGRDAFSGCPRLTNVTCMAISPPTIDEYAFDSEVTLQATLYVPRGSVAAYQTADNWKDFSQIIGIPTIDDFEVDGIWYRALSENTTMVISRPEEDYYSGDVVIPEEVTCEDYTFTVTAIDDEAFEDCYELNSVEIGNAVESIGEEALQGCTGLTSLTIGSGVTSIGAKAFNYCNALQTVTCRGTVPPVMANVNCFSNAAYSRATLLVPRQQLEAYQGADYWYKFSHIEGWGSAGMGDVNADGRINITDVTALIGLVLTYGDYNAYADLNHNGRLEIGDVTSLIVMILHQ